MKIYDFRAQLAHGESGENLFKTYFEKQGYSIIPATRQEQFKGIDFHLVNAEGMPVTVEVKTDSYKSGNVFVELVSNSETKTQGWAYKTAAEWLVYYLKAYGYALVIRPSSLRSKLPQWIEEFPSKEVPNPSYKTIGILVPIVEFQTISIQKIEL